MSAVRSSTRGGAGSACTARRTARGTARGDHERGNDEHDAIPRHDGHGVSPSRPGDATAKARFVPFASHFVGLTSNVAVMPALTFALAVALACAALHAQTPIRPARSCFSSTTSTSISADAAHPRVMQRLRRDVAREGDFWAS